MSGDDEKNDLPQEYHFNSPPLSHYSPILDYQYSDYNQKDLVKSEFNDNTTTSCLGELPYIHFQVSFLYILYQFDKLIFYC